MSEKPPVIMETYTRVFVESAQIEPAIARYRTLLGGTVTLRFAYPEAGLALAAVSSERLSILIVAGPADRRAPFEATRLTVRVDRLEPYVEILRRDGATELDPVQPTPVGRKTRFRHPDGLIVEYVDRHAP